jgi:aspartate/methionine/tyrosine aminotransferase
VVARFFNQHFKPLHPVEMDHVLVTDGATTALEAVAYALAESGDAFLLGRPHYQQFPLDIGSRAGYASVDSCTYITDFTCTASRQSSFPLARLMYLVLKPYASTRRRCLPPKKRVSPCER